MAATTSGIYLFGSATNDLLISESYQRGTGNLPDSFTAQQVQSCLVSFNLLLNQWINRGLNLWTVRQEMLNLMPNQNTYTLPPDTSDILEATIRTSTRQLGGTAFSSAGGTASYAFDGNPNTACTQTASNGYISYNYGTNTQYAIAMVGIQSNTTTLYTLVAEYSYDNATWYNSITIPAQTFITGNNLWFVANVPTLAQYYRVRETGGATLNIQELYFNTTLEDLPISRLSRAEYINLPQKNQTGRPTSFYVNRLISPTVSLWPTPVPPYFNMFYTRVLYMQDAGSLINTPQIPQRFFEAIVAGLAVKFAEKLSPDRLSFLQPAYKEAFDEAAREDRERVPLRIYGDYSSGWGGQP